LAFELVSRFDLVGCSFLQVSVVTYVCLSGELSDALKTVK